MARGIVVEHGGAVSQFALEKVERAKLYGSRKRIALDGEGQACIRGSLTDDGQVLLRAGMTAQGYFDREGRQVENAAIGAVDKEGKALPLVPSTLGVQQPLEGPVDAREVLDMSLTTVYRLVPEQLDPALEAALTAGKAFRVAFNYRPDYRSEVAYLVKNDAGLFALIGNPAPASWLAPDAPPPVEGEGEEEAELDFEMF